jgi:hypothetical protein
MKYMLDNPNKDMMYIIYISKKRLTLHASHIFLIFNINYFKYSNFNNK